MGVMIDAREMSVSDLKALRATVKETLLNMVAEKSKKPKTSLIVRDILPLTDLGLNTEEWDNETAQVAGAWTEDWHHQLNEDEGVAFYGVHFHDDTFDLIFIRHKLGATGATVKNLTGLTPIDNNENDLNKGYHKPVYYSGNENVYIDYYARANVAAAAAHVELIGMFCEPRGEQIS